MSSPGLLALAHRHAPPLARTAPASTCDLAHNTRSHAQHSTAAATHGSAAAAGILSYRGQKLSNNCA
eukprot:4601254-Pleurochrysis_carterae.AAC.1